MGASMARFSLASISGYSVQPIDMIARFCERMIPETTGMS
jgi:hypothetical protein